MTLIEQIRAGYVRPHSDWIWGRGDELTRSGRQKWGAGRREYSRPDGRPPHREDEHRRLGSLACWRVLGVTLFNLEDIHIKGEHLSGQRMIEIDQHFLVVHFEHLHQPVIRCL